MAEEYSVRASRRIQGGVGVALEFALSGRNVHKNHVLYNYIITIAYDFSGKGPDFVAF